MISHIRDNSLYKTCIHVLDDPKFLNGIASRNHHHSYPGGLLVHTAEVMHYALHLSTSFDKTNYDVLIAAVLFHDYMKSVEYDPEFVEPSDYNHSSWHITNGAYYWQSVANKNEVSSDIIQQVRHCILSHHGHKDWGSYVEPQTLEARILHFADMLSAFDGKTKDSYETI